MISQDQFRFVALWLCGICIFVFVLQLFIPGFTAAFLLDFSAFSQPWRFVTALFLHGDITHLLYNLLALGLFGSILERLIGWKKLLLVFFTAGILANIISVFFYDSSLGASGALFGVIGSLIIVRPTLQVWVYFLPLPIWLAGILWAAGDILGLFMPSNIANIAHLSGLGFGLLLGLFFRDWAGARRLRMLQRNRPRVIIHEPSMRAWEDRFLR